MGRTRRGKLLIPSLIAVAVAIACGGTSVGGDGQGILDPNEGPDSTGGRYGGGATESSGGANSIPQGGPAYAGAPTAAGGAGVFYGCPPSVPPPGSRCAMPPNGLGACPYTDSCGQSVVAICRQGGNWEVLASAMECDGSAGARNDPTLPLSCPSLRPPQARSVTSRRRSSATSACIPSAAASCSRLATNTVPGPPPKPSATALVPAARAKSSSDQHFLTRERRDSLVRSQDAAVIERVRGGSVHRFAGAAAAHRAQERDGFG